MRDIWPEWDRDQKKWVPEIVVFHKTVDDLDPDIEKKYSGPVTPDWAKWKFMRAVPVRTAVLLALNLNPDIFHYFAADASPVVFSNLLEVSMGLHSLRLDIGHQMVDLVDYGKYAEGNLKALLIGGVLPPEFPRVIIENLQESDPKLTSDDDPYVPPYTTPKLRKLFKAMAVIDAGATKLDRAVIMEVMGEKDRQAGILAALIKKHHDGHSERWKSEGKKGRGGE
jgi:hypothetical protein